jgi:hypothetical protein
MIVIIQTHGSSVPSIDYRCEDRKKAGELKRPDHEEDKHL